MDRLDAIAVFVAVAEEGSFVAAARKLRRSPAAVTRAVAALEGRLGVRLLNRTTRAVSPTDAGLRQLETCRRLLADVEALEASAEGDRAEPQGLLTVTAPVVFGRLHVLPVLLDCLHSHPRLSARLLLLDRVAGLVEEGIDVAVRIGRLPDSSLRALKVGSLRRLLCASPAYLARRGVPATPHDLLDHACIAFEGDGPVPERWSFGPPGAGVSVVVRPCLTVTTAEAAVDAAAAGLGFARPLSYQAEAALAAGWMTVVLREFEPVPVPVHIVQPSGRHPPPKVRVFVERAAMVLRARLAALNKAVVGA